MAENKQLGAKVMFDQSLIYLYNSYRKEGKTSEEAKALVGEYMAEVYHKYAVQGVVKSPSITSPKFLVHEIINDLGFLLDKKDLKNRRLFDKLQHLLEIL